MYQARSIIPQSKRFVWPNDKPPFGARLNKRHPLAKGLVGAWVMNERAGNRLIDLSGNGNTGTINDAKWVPDGLKFNNTDDYVGIGDITSYFTDKATLSMWLRAGETTQNGFCKIDNVNSSSHYPYNNTIYLGVFRDDRLTVGASDVDIKKLHLLTITNEPGANNWKVYQNGKEIYNATGEDIIHLAAALKIGQSHSYIYGFDGVIVNTFLHNRVFTPAEVAWLYRKPYAMFQPAINPALFYSPAVCAGNPMWYYKMLKARN